MQYLLDEDEFEEFKKFKNDNAKIAKTTSDTMRALQDFIKKSKISLATSPSMSPFSVLVLQVETTDVPPYIIDLIEYTHGIRL